MFLGGCAARKEGAQRGRRVRSKTRGCAARQKGAQLGNGASEEKACAARLELVGECAARFGEKMTIFQISAYFEKKILKNTYFEK